MLGIRCDANSIIASGHMMRCLTIAKDVVKLGEEVTFFVADEQSKAVFDAFVGDSEHIKIAVLGSDWQDLVSELPGLTEELKNRNIKNLLVDSYSVSVPYFEQLKDHVCVAYLDDLHKDTYPVDMLINYSGYYKILNYEAAYRNMHGHNNTPTKLLLGLEYAPLREQFYKDEEDINCNSDVDGVRQVLVTSGGADTLGMLPATLKALKDIRGAQFHIVVGSLAADAADIEKMAADCLNVEIHKEVKDMAALMRRCDIAICAAGTMLTECSAINLPAIFYQVADNQKYNVEFWGDTDGMIFAGDVTKGPLAVAQTTENIAMNLRNLLDEPSRLSEMRSALKGLTDGRGAQRIARALLPEK